MDRTRESAPTRIIGECGHEHCLVGYRSKHIITLLGEVEFKRPYYHCKGGKEENPLVDDKEEKEGEKEQEKCIHASVPDDELWGVQGTRTTPGVQKIISSFSAIMTLEEACLDLFSGLSGEDVPATSAQLTQTSGKCVSHTRG